MGCPGKGDNDFAAGIFVVLVVQNENIFYLRENNCVRQGTFSKIF